MVLPSCYANDLIKVPRALASEQPVSPITKRPELGVFEFSVLHTCHWVQTMNPSQTSCRRIHSFTRNLSAMLAMREQSNGCV
jgi:hypothetical protein